jgi:hypothetical protein
MKKALNRLVLVLTTALILAFTAGCATYVGEAIPCEVTVNAVVYNCQCTVYQQSVNYYSQCVQQ